MQDLKENIEAGTGAGVMSSNHVRVPEAVEVEGGKTSKGTLIPHRAIQQLQDREEMLSKKQEFLEKMEQKLKAVKKPSSNKYTWQ
ncbi:Charged multivesicular body protein 4b [Sciurus carolinensis]|uniref:Charged multivesicular body protein 4b n=1 Tax=Sciurus carolinensis TaxID=30640 RepID=A0AA41N1B1_SCICA|nr:Charged multivesicular body protein 4b [Sciurus carolinensis]